VRMERRVESRFLNPPRVCVVLKDSSSGGYGSNGADGAAAGNVFVTVHDEDTDLLIPVEYDVKGGAGGASGQHGEPGDGGVGGRGGEGHVWTEKHGNSVSAHARPGGANGQNGHPGNRPTTYLTGGQSYVYGCSIASFKGRC
jgi:hypothetical protein